jgi:CSLREA domain-containing protein
MKRGAVLLFTAALVALVMAVGIVERPSHAAAPFTVNSTADTGVATPDGTCSSTCTLREAIQEANVTAGADTIEFNIPDTDTGCNAGVCTISPSSALPLITNPVIIDGYSQPGASANTLAVGNDAMLKIELKGPDVLNGLKIEADDSTVQGLIVSNWENGIFLGVDATGNTVRGNFIGTDPSGTADLDNTIGVALTNALNNTIGGTTAGARNIISDNGTGISISGGTDNKIQGNYIGTNAAGDARLGNNQGVVLSNTPNNTIGGTTAAARNIISGNGTWGVLISDPDSTDNKVQGNYIGTDVTGTVTDPDGTPNNGDELGNGLNGVVIRTGAANNIIGGTKATAGNIISGNGNSGANPLNNTLSGVEVQFDNSDAPNKAVGNRILSNSIYDNVKLGIDLYYTNDPPGVTPNDEDDPDAGPNNLQNFPVITSARLTTRRIGGHRRKVTLIKGTLNSEADKTYNVQFFGSPVADPSGNGEGKKFLGQKSVKTDSSGDASFTFQTRKKVPNGQVVTATATDQSTGDTSEFSKACTVPGVPCP